MGTYVCKHCGGRIIFRRWRVVNGKLEVRAKPFPIHLDGGSCR